MDTEAKKLFFHPPVAARASLQAAAGSGQDPASICHCQDKETDYIGKFRPKPIAIILSRKK